MQFNIEINNDIDFLYAVVLWLNIYIVIYIGYFG